MINISKAFDTVNQKTLLENLETIVDESGMRMMYLTKIDGGKKFKGKFLTKIGVAQGDCLSTLLFIFYLAQFLDVIPGLPLGEDFGNAFLWSKLDWLIERDTSGCWPKTCRRRKFYKE